MRVAGAEAKKEQKAAEKICSFLKDSKGQQQEEMSQKGKTERKKIKVIKRMEGQTLQRKFMEKTASICIERLEHFYYRTLEHYTTFYKALI